MRLMMERFLGTLASRARSDGLIATLYAGVFKSLMFLSAYSPLGVILAVILWNGYSIVLIGVSLGSIVLLVSFLHGLKRSEPKRVQVQQLQRRDEQIVSYIVTYAIPFLAVPFESGQMAFGLVLFFVLIWFLQVRLDLLHINPILSVLRYHMYEVTTSGVTQILLCKRRLGPDSVVYAARVGDTILCENRR